MRRKHTIIIVLLAAAAVAALVAGGVWAYRHDRAMHAALMDLRAQNQADTVFGTFELQIIDGEWLFYADIEL